jgi:signal transduction histidine kinase
VSRFLTLPRPRTTAQRARTVGGNADRRSRSVPAARLGWGVLAALALALLAAGVPVEFALLQTPCPTAICATGQLPPSGLDALSDLGLSPAFYSAGTVTMDIVFAAVYCTISALIVWRRPTDRVAVFASVALLLFATATFGFTFSALALAHPSLQIPVSALQFLGAACFGLLLYVFPDGRFVPGWTRWVAIGWIGWQLAEHVVPAWNTDPTTWQVAVESVVWLSAGATVIYSQVRRYRTAPTSQQQQIKWVVFGIVVAFAGFLATNVTLTAMNALPEPGTPRQVLAYLLGYSLASYLLLLVVPVTIGIAVLRHRLLDIDLVISRALVYGILTGGVIGLYVLVVGALGTAVRSLGNLMASLLAVGVTAVAFAPARSRLQRAANRLVYGHRDEPYAVISQLGQRLESTLMPDAVLPAAVRTVRDALKLPYVAIELQRGASTTVAAVAGDPVRDPLRQPLVYAGESVGHLVLGPRIGEEGFTAGERRLLGDLAHQIAVAAHAVRLTEEAVRLSADLQRSRERLVTAREEERRRLRRDLHDELGPQIATLAMTADAARDAIASDPIHARHLLDGLIGQTQEAVADVRRLGSELRPPALDALGLIGALRMLADQPSGLRVDVAAPHDLPRLPAAVEVAAYRIAAEAVRNTVRHADASTCRLRIAFDRSRGGLLIEIADDGHGIGPDPGSGVGLSSMHERAAELGGTLTIANRSPRGTLVSAALPCPTANGKARTKV